MKKNLPNPLDEPQLPNPLNEPELPKPDEKLLPKPTLTERYSWLRPIIIIAIIILCIDFGIFNILHTESKPNQNDNQQPQKQALKLETTENWKTYTSQPGKFTIKYPTEYSFTENPQKIPNSIIITSNPLPNINTTFKITMQYRQTNTQQTLSESIDQNKICPTIASQTGITTTLNKTISGKLYKDVPCQQSFKTVFYLQNKNLFYIVTIDAQEKFDTLKIYLDPIFSTLRFLQ